MGVILSSLTPYIEENKSNLIAKTVQGAKTASIFNLQTGVKGPTSLNLLATSATWQEGKNCAWNAAGTATISQRLITPGTIKVQMSFCDKSFLNYFNNYEVKVAAGMATLPFEEEIVGNVIENITSNLETAIWQSVAGSTGASHLSHFDGMLKLIDGATGVVKPTGATGDTVRTSVELVYANIPVTILPKAQIFVGQDTFRTLVMQLVSANLYNYVTDVNDSMSITLPGTNTKIVAVPGLDGTKRIIAADPMNLFYGVDLANDSENFEFWYSQDAREFRLEVAFNAGVQVAYPSEVVSLTHK